MVEPDRHEFNLEDEVLCDHFVSAKTKRLWAVELDLAEQLRKICEKHDITYYAGGGTLLGAVRHHGFIPWDDDMDFFMLKDDYDRFCHYAKDELEEPYAFQQTFALSRIRNSNTTGCTKSELRVVQPYNLGIFIDIFPLNAVPEDVRERRRHKRQIRLMRIARRGERMFRSAESRDNLTVASWLKPQVLLWRGMTSFSKRSLFDRYMALCAKYEPTMPREIGLTTFLPYQERYIWNREWYTDGVVMFPFENMEVPVPSRYDEILRKTYGDYHEFVKGDSQHEMPICEPDIPYKEYLKSNVLGR